MALARLCNSDDTTSAASDRARRVLPVDAAAHRALADVGRRFQPELGPLRHVLAIAVAYVLFALLSSTWRRRSGALRPILSCTTSLRYDAERWLATAVYDPEAISSARSIRASIACATSTTPTAPSTLGDYVANPDHKSIPVREVPEQYWRCLAYHEDRYSAARSIHSASTSSACFKIPYTTLTRSIAAQGPSLGVGGSTLPMQFARVIYKTPPSPDESGPPSSSASSANGGSRR